VSGRHRPASCPPPGGASQPQRVYEIPVNVVSSKDKPAGRSPKSPALSGIQPLSHIQTQFETSRDAERKLATLMSQLETEMNSAGGATPASGATPAGGSAPAGGATMAGGSVAGVKKQLSELSVTPMSVSTVAKSPPPYHGPHITEFFARPPQLGEENLFLRFFCFVDSCNT